jgi:hypothetical protein
MKNPDVKDIVKAIRARFRHSEGHSFGTPAHVEKDWKLILTTFVVLSLIIIVINVLIFYRVTKGVELSGESASATTTLETFSKEELLNAAEEVSKKRQRYLELKTTKPQIADPSN